MVNNFLGFIFSVLKKRFSLGIAEKKGGRVLLE